MLQEFKKFAMQGNVMDMAVGIIIGVAFGAIIASFVGDILMPTPPAVLQAAQLLAEGCEGESGIGELVLVDVGGATTDIHSIATGHPSRSDWIPRGLPEPRAKRTVEGDLGLRWNAEGIVETAGAARLRARLVR